MKNQMKLPIYFPFFCAFFYILGILSYWSYQFTNQNVDVKIENYEKIRQQTIKESEEFLNKIMEAGISLKSNDTITARNKIIEAKSILVDLSNNYNFICSFQIDNRELFQNITDLDIKKCKGWIEIYRACFPKYLDSYYAMTYLVEKLNQIKTQEDIDNFKKLCQSWLNDYNVVRGSCNTIIDLYELDLKKFEYFSNICNFG